MQYMIDNAKQPTVSGTLLIRDDKIQQINEYSRFLTYQRMACNGMTLTPGRVCVDKTVQTISDHNVYKQHFKERQVLGCTTSLVIFSIDHEKQLSGQIKKYRQHMINASIDFAFGVAIPLNKITPSLIRSCRRHNIAMIEAIMPANGGWEQMTWSYIREVLFPRPLPIIPNWENVNIPEKKLSRLKQRWKNYSQTYNIPSSSDQLSDGDILSKDLLKKIGFYPYKGVFSRGSDADYILFTDGQTKPLAEDNNLFYDGERPEIVVLRNEILKAGAQTIYRPGFGKEFNVKFPGMFV